MKSMNIRLCTVKHEQLWYANEMTIGVKYVICIDRGINISEPFIQEFNVIQ